jgi:hypothetical protein
MSTGAIPENVGAILIIIATVIFATIFYAVLSGLAGMDNPGVTQAKFEVDQVLGIGASGKGDTPVIRLGYREGMAIPANCTDVRLTDPYGTQHRVLAAILRDGVIEAGDEFYIFSCRYDDPRTTGYWYTDEADMIFTTAYRDLCGPEPFSPPGRWKLTVIDERFGKKMIDTTLTIK